MTEPILHLTFRTDWQTALEAGSYQADSLSSEGFIHCSKPEQVERVANAYYHGKDGLVLLVIDPQKVTPEIRWEPGTDKPDELFPHIYGPLDLEAVLQVIDFEPNPDGSFTLLPDQPLTPNPDSDVA
jgi:uncharacterized protein (DUF952 family)